MRLSLFACLLLLQSEAQQPTTREVEVGQPPRSLEFLAVVAPRRAVAIGAPRDGILRSVEAALGGKVEAGAVMATLETRPLELDLAAAVVSRKEAEGERAKAEIVVERALDLRERVRTRPDSFSENERSEAEFSLRIAQEELAIVGARAERDALEVARLEELLRRSEVLAPFAGVVAARYLDGGATVTRATPLLRLISDDDLIVRFALPAELAAALRRGALVEFRRADGRATLALRVENVAPEVDGALEMVIVEAGLLEPAADLKPGTDGVVRLANGSTLPASSAPS